MPNNTCFKIINYHKENERRRAEMEAMCEKYDNSKTHKRSMEMDTEIIMDIISRKYLMKT